MRIDAETLVVISPCDKELLEVRDTVQLAVVQSEGVHPVRTHYTVISFDCTQQLIIISVLVERIFAKKEVFFRYLKMQLHWRHRKHCLWKILLFVSTFSKG